MNIKHWLLASLLLALSTSTMADHRHREHATHHGYYAAHDYHHQRERAYWRGYRHGYKDARREHHSYRNRHNHGQASIHYRRHVHSHYCDHRPRFNSRVHVMLNL